MLLLISSIFILLVKPLLFFLNWAEKTKNYCEDDIWKRHSFENGKTDKIKDSCSWTYYSSNPHTNSEPVIVGHASQDSHLLKLQSRLFIMRNNEPSANNNRLARYNFHFIASDGMDMIISLDLLVPIHIFEVSYRTSMDIDNYDFIIGYNLWNGHLGFTMSGQQRTFTVSLFQSVCNVIRLVSVLAFYFS